MSIKGYKVFENDWTCRGFQYEVGKTFKYNGNIEMCGAGFHFCRKAGDCFNYYSFNSNNKVAEVEAIGLVETSDNKSVTDEIVIVREIEWHELLDIVNEGKDCTGLCNTGDCNTGNWNTGFFNTNDGVVYAFNKPLKMSRKDFLNCKGVQVINWNYENNWWVYSQNMTKEEKQLHPEHKTTGGYLKSVPFKHACKLMWKKLTDEEKQAVKDIPNFKKEVFEEITGIKV